MTHFLVSDTNPDGYLLEDILRVLRKDIMLRCTKVVDDHRSEAQHVIDNNVRILGLLSDAIKLSEDSTAILKKAFGPSTSTQGGKPRIGAE